LESDANTTACEEVEELLEEKEFGEVITRLMASPERRLIPYEDKEEEDVEQD